MQTCFDADPVDQQKFPFLYGAFDGDIHFNNIGVHIDSEQSVLCGYSESLTLTGMSRRPLFMSVSYSDLADDQYFTVSETNGDTYEEVSNCHYTDAGLFVVL